MKSINDPFGLAALSEQKLPEYCREYSARRTEEDEWAGIKKHFETLCADIEHYCVETREQALEGTRLVDDPEIGPGFKYKHESVVPFRKTDDHPMLEEQFRMAQALIPKVRADIKARTMNFDFMRDWGLLCYASGYVMCTWFARDSDDLGSDRGVRRSAENRNKDRHRYFIALHTLPLLNEGVTRKRAELIAATKINAAIAANNPMPLLATSELRELLNDKGHLKTTYCGKKFTKKEMEALLDGEGQSLLLTSNT